MAHGNSGVPVHKHCSHGFSDHIAVTYDHCMFALYVNIVFLKCTDDTLWSAWYKFLNTDEKLTHVEGVETICILCRVYGIHCFLLIKVFWKWQLQEDTMDVLSCIQFLDKVKEFFLGRGLRKRVVLCINAYTVTRF